MTTLTNQITIARPRAAVWQALTTLDLLDQYDPGVRSSRLVGEQSSGLGAQRRCDLRPAGWFIERVALWQPEQALAFELVTCSLPVSSLRHDYTLTQAPDHTGARTVVTQTMTYQLKYGLAGKALDAAMMRRQWDRGIKAFLHGLQQHVQAQHAAPTPE
jgi:uncharacterized protein YndB with AHSA1/START domain